MRRNLINLLDIFTANAPTNGMIASQEVDLSPPRILNQPLPNNFS
jgi:hypothetical protein